MSAVFRPRGYELIGFSRLHSVVAPYSIIHIKCDTFSRCVAGVTVLNRCRVCGYACTASQCDRAFRFVLFCATKFGMSYLLATITCVHTFFDRALDQRRDRACDRASDGSFE